MLQKRSFVQHISGAVTRSLHPALPRLLLGFWLAALAIGLLAARSEAQLPLGQVQNQQALTSCPGHNWFFYTSGSNTYNMNCVSASLNSCPGAQNMAFTYGYLSPSVINVPLNGVIVYIDGGGGTLPAGESVGATSAFSQLTYYFRQGYEIVQLAWSSDWEAVDLPWPYSTQPLGNIQAAACRPATFLNFVYSTIFDSISQANPKAGMCAQGLSAGSAQVAYSMAYYGAASWLDNVELISGPVFSDVKQGCLVPNATPVTVCPSGQYGCQLGTDTPWTLPPTYDVPQNGSVGAWTDDPTCAGSGTTSSSSNAAWLAQSIVDQGTGATPTFSYPSTAMTAWLCRTLANQHTVSQCAADYTERYCPNNSSPQGEIFYSQITGANPPAHYNVYSVDNCNGSEGVIDTDSQVSALNNEDGLDAIKFDMAGGGGQTAQCVHGPH